MTTIKQTKTKTYINFNGEIFITNNDWSNRVFTTADYSTMNQQQIDAIKSDYNWMQIGEFENIDAAYSAFLEILKSSKEQRRNENEILSRKNEERKISEWNSIKDLAVIPATIENVRIVLEHLNDQNWGGWKLPQMSIGYKAAQYDCDGVQASTMTFNKPIEGKKKFKVGGKRRHLNQYQSL